MKEIGPDCSFDYLNLINEALKLATLVREDTVVRQFDKKVDKKTDSDLNKHVESIICQIYFYLSHYKRKPGFGFFRPGPTQIGLCSHRRLEA